MNWKAYSGHRSRGYYSYRGDRGNTCGKFNCGEYATYRANIMLGKVATWIYSCSSHRKEWP